MRKLKPQLQALATKTLASFMLQDLRRFVMYDSSATMPYLVSAMSNWARAERLGYITLNESGKVGQDLFFCCSGSQSFYFQKSLPSGVLKGFQAIMMDSNWGSETSMLQAWWWYAAEMPDLLVQASRIFGLPLHGLRILVDVLSIAWLFRKEIPDYAVHIIESHLFWNRYIDDSPTVENSNCLLA